jgi:hypothetical protein
MTRALAATAGCWWALGKLGARAAGCELSPGSVALAALARRRRGDVAGAWASLPSERAAGAAEAAGGGAGVRLALVGREGLEASASSSSSSSSAGVCKQPERAT